MMSHPLGRVLLVRILHTSDWHLGRSFHGFPLLEHQQEILEWMVDLVEAEHVDAVVVAGDVYDRAIPPTEAIECFEWAVGAMREAGARIVAIAGNHDSPVRLGPFDPLLSRVGVTLRGGTRSIGTPAIVPASDGGPDLLVYPIPYLEPELARHGLGDEDARTHEAVLDRALALVAADRADRGDHRCLVVAHAFVAGGAASESERPLSIGGAEQVPASMLEGFDYAALGHLHSPQAVGERARYSGSPLAYSFAESDQTKSVTLVDLAPAGEIEIDVRPIPAPRGLARLKGCVQDLLDDASLAFAECCWVEVTMTDAVPALEPFHRLKSRFPHLASLIAAPHAADGAGPTTPPKPGQGRTDLELALDFVEVVTGRPPSEAERVEIEAAMSEVHAAEASA